LRPAWAAGLGLVALYACADFGVVESFGTRTFTQAIFFEQNLEQDRLMAWGRSALLAMVLIIIAFPLYLADRATRKKARYEHATGKARRGRVLTASPGLQLGIWLLVLAICTPTSLLVLLRSISYLPGLDDPGRIWTNAFNAMGYSLIWAVLAATMAMVAAAIVSWVSNRSRTPIHRGLVPLSSLGYVLPGPVVALGLLIVVAGFGPLRASIYGTAAILVFAYVVRYLPEAIQATESGVAQAPVVLEEAARTLGSGPLGALMRVTVPIMSGSLLAAWVLVFTASMRELPATLLLKPLGSRTLSTEIWKYALDSWYADMAPSALLLMAVSIPAVAVLLLRGHQK